MALYAIGDLHLSLGPADKPMDVFGGRWTGYMEKLRENLKVIGRRTRPSCSAISAGR